MADCHRRVSNAACKSRSGFNNAGWRHRSASASSSDESDSDKSKEEEKFTVVYLVRSFRTYARIRSLTTGTFNLVVKDRIAFRLSGAPSVLDGLAFLGQTQQERIRLSSKPFKHIARTPPCQRQRPTAFPRDFHTGNLLRTRGQESSTHVCLVILPPRLAIPSGFTARNLLSGNSTARNDIALRLEPQKTPMNRRTPKRKTES